MIVDANSHVPVFEQIAGSIRTGIANGIHWPGEMMPVVDAALAELPEELREPLVQHFLLGRTQVLISQGWRQDGHYLPWAGIVTRVHADGEIIGATINGRKDNRLGRPVGIWSLSPGTETPAAHEAGVMRQ